MKSIFNLIDENKDKNTHLLSRLLHKIDELQAITSKFKEKQDKIEEDIFNIKFELKNQNSNNFEEKLNQIERAINSLKELKHENLNDSEVYEEIEEPQKIEKTKKINLIDNKKERKNIIKKQILEIILQGEINISELKKICVDQNNICSRATLYRYISDFIQAEFIENININGQTILIKKREKIKL